VILQGLDIDGMEWLEAKGWGVPPFFRQKGGSPPSILTHFELWAVFFFFFFFSLLLRSSWSRWWSLLALSMTATQNGCSEWWAMSMIRLKLPYFVPAGITIASAVVFIAPTFTRLFLSHLVTAFKYGWRSWQTEKWTLPVAIPSPELIFSLLMAEARTVNVVSLNAGTVTSSIEHRLERGR
jgi:hypothetical protein